MDELEIGFYSAVAVYALIVAWTVLVRLRWLPVGLVRFVHRLLNRLGRIPFLGRAVIACRRYPLRLGLVWAVLAGLVMPYLLLSVFWAFQAAFLAGAVWLGLRYGSADSSEDERTDPIWDYDSEWSAGRGRVPRS